MLDKRERRVDVINPTASAMAIISPISYIIDVPIGAYITAITIDGFIVAWKRARSDLNVNTIADNNPEGKPNRDLELGNIPLTTRHDELKGQSTNG